MIKAQAEIRPCPAQQKKDLDRHKLPGWWQASRNSFWIWVYQKIPASNKTCLNRQRYHPFGRNIQPILFWCITFTWDWGNLGGRLKTRNPKRTLTWPCEGVHNGGATHFSPIKTEVGVKFGKIFFLRLHISAKLALERKSTSFYCHGNEEIHQKWLLKLIIDGETPQCSTYVWGCWRATVWGEGSPTATETPKKKMALREVYERGMNFSPSFAFIKASESAYLKNHFQLHRARS